MKKLALTAALLLLIAMPAAAQSAAGQDYGLPELHVIGSATLAPSYSCRAEEDARQGYQQTALFLSRYARRRNSPDLLFNGACGGTDSFQSSTAGDDMAFVVDLGPDLKLETLTAQEVMHLYYRRSARQPADSGSFQAVLRQDAVVSPGHTYAVFLNKQEIRGLFVFTVTSHVQNQKATIRYAVKSYQIMDVRAQSTGFSWDQQNSAAERNPPVEKTQGGEPR